MSEGVPPRGGWLRHRREAQRPEARTSEAGKSYSGPFLNPADKPGNDEKKNNVQNRENRKLLLAQNGSLLLHDAKDMDAAVANVPAENSTEVAMGRRR